MIEKIYIPENKWCRDAVQMRRNVYQYDRQLIQTKTGNKRIRK